MMTSDLKQPPHSLHAEQSLLGGLMLDNSAWDRISDAVAAEDFYRREHRLIFRGIAKLAAEDQPFDVVTLAETLERNGQIEGAGGLAYFGTLLSETPSAANIRAYAKIVRDTSVRHQMIAAAAEIADSTYNPGDMGTPDLIDAAQRAMAGLNRTAGAGATSIKATLRRLAEMIDQNHASGEKMIGVSTGFTDLDRMTAGLHPGQLIVLGASPKVGKTSLATSIAQAVARQGKGVVLFSLEMTDVELVGRILAGEVGAAYPRLMRGKLEGDEWESLTRAIKANSDLPIDIDSSAAVTPELIRARARRYAQEQGNTGLIVVDYIQLMRVPGVKAENRYAQVTEITRSLKILAQDLRVPVLALSQLNRAAYGKRPELDHLRDSGSIEQDADMVWLLYREGAFNPKTPNPGIAELNVAVQRNGPTGDLLLTWLGKRMRFENFVSGPTE